MKDFHYKNRKYTVEPYNPAWKERFAKEAETLRSAFGSQIVSLEQVGSTSVPGLAGKPTIDILLTVRDIRGVDDVFSQKMEAFGYVSLGEYVTHNAKLFAKETDNTRFVNLHVFEHSHPHVQEMLDLRNYFRTHSDVVQEYSALKFSLFAKYPNDYGLYRKQKDTWMDDLKRAIHRTPKGSV